MEISGGVGGGRRRTKCRVYILFNSGVGTRGVQGKLPTPNMLVGIENFMQDISFALIATAHWAKNKISRAQFL